MKSRTARAHFNTSKRSGFTMIELLTVIAIIAILTAIIFPVFGAVRENARRASCMSNMQQLSTATKMFELDNRRYPDFLFSPAIKKFTGASGEVNSGGCALINNRPVIAPAGTAACRPEEATSTGKLGGDFVDTTGNVVASGGLYPEYIKSTSTFLCPNNSWFYANGDSAFSETPGTRGYPVTSASTASKDSIRYNAYTLDKSTAATLNDTVQFPMYKFDSYDTNPAVIKDGTGTAQNKIDLDTWVVRYARQWVPLVNDPNTITVPAQRHLYQNQLLWKNPGEDAVLTMCTHHVTKGKVVVVLLSGTAKVLDNAVLKNKAATTEPGRDFDTNKMVP